MSCGYALDYLRSGYYTRMKLWRDQQTMVMGRWIRLADDAPFFPFPHPFGSFRTWDRQLPRNNTDLGEQGYAGYYNGAKPAGFVPKGYCGRDEAIQDGGVTGVDPPIVHDEEGRNECCYGYPDLCGGYPFPGVSLVATMIVETSDYCPCLQGQVVPLNYAPPLPTALMYHTWISPIIATPGCSSDEGYLRGFDLILLIPKPGPAPCPPPLLQLRVFKDDPVVGWVQDGFAGFGTPNDYVPEPLLIRDYWGDPPPELASSAKVLIYDNHPPPARCWFIGSGAAPGKWMVIEVVPAPYGAGTQPRTPRA